MKTILAFIFGLMLCSNFAIAECKATVFLKDWQGNFQSLTDGFDWCFERAKSWDLDLSDGWKKRYCNARTVYDRYGGIKGYDFLFFHKDLEYSALYSRSIFYALDIDYSSRLFNGYAKTIEIKFNDSCGYPDDDY